MSLGTTNIATQNPSEFSRKDVIIVNRDGQIDVVFCDDSSVPDMPEETAEQAAVWAAEKEQFVEKCRAYLNETA